MIKEQDYIFKIVLVGNQGVGKSSLFLRFCDNNFIENYLTTIGVDFRFRMLDVDDKVCKLQIWDTAGQQRFRTITSAYYRNSQAVLIIYDVTDPSSFQEIQQFWLQQVKANTDSDVLIAIVGNKSDLRSQISDIQVNEFIQTVNLPAYFLSAKSGDGVQKMFVELCQTLIQNTKLRKPEKEKKLRSRQNRQIPEKKKCCGK